jgi:hypothetical protein
MSPRFTISAVLSLLCNSASALGDGQSVSVSGYPVPVIQADAVQQGYQPENTFSFAFVSRNRGYTNANAQPRHLCRAFTQPDGPRLYIIAAYQNNQGCKLVYKKQLS